jgi:type IV secretory pathway protease TraF
MTIASKTLALTLLASGAVVLPSVASPPPQLIWNASASVPIGLYRVQPEPEPNVSDIVVVRPPEPLVGFLSDGGYLPRGVPLLSMWPHSAGSGSVESDPPSASTA